MWHLYHGPNEIERDEELANQRALLGDATIVALNTTRLDSNAAVKDIIGACDTYSFLEEQRLVVVRTWLSKVDQPKRKASKDQDEQQSRLLAYLPEVPEGTTLVLVEDTTLPDTHSFVKSANAKGSGGTVKKFEVPKDAQSWIIERAKAKGGVIAPAAAQALSTRINKGDQYDRDHFAEDVRLYLRKLDNELNKLVAYALGRRIETADVVALVAEEDISAMFQFIDAVSAKDGHTAYRLMQGILARGESPLVIMTMLARQTRLMISAKEYDKLSADQLAEAIGVHPYVAKKIIPQARRFNMTELERAHLTLMETDLAVKTGRMEDVAALDLLIATMCGS